MRAETSAPRLARAGLSAALLLTISLAGCFGFSPGVSGFEPGEGYEPTGKTVHLKATVVDMLNAPVYPGLNVNFWAFCFEAATPGDKYSEDAIEYYPDNPAVVSDEFPSWKGKCSVPGPTLRVHQGDLVKVEFKNDHLHHHTIHWHGQYVPWESDGVPGSTQDSVANGELFIYEYEAKRAGTLWYHCHVDTQLHVMQGLYGVIIVEPQDQSMEPKDIDRDQVLVFSTLHRELMENTPARQANPHVDHLSLGSCGETGQPGCQNPVTDVTADTWMINGVSFPMTLDNKDALIQLEPGERLRLRILNAGTTFETLHPHGHDFEVTHLDGNPIPPSARVFRDTLPIGPGERIDVVLEGREGNEGIWVMHTHVVSHVTNDGQYPGGALSKIVYPEYMDDLKPFKSENAGGQTYIAPMKFPKDTMIGQKIGLGTRQSTDAAEIWTFEQETACAVQGLTLSVAIDSPGTLEQSLNDVTVRFQDPNSDTLVALEIGDKRFMQWSYAYDREAAASVLKDGTYTVDIRGQTIDAIATVEILLDYYDDVEEHQAQRSPCGVSGNGVNNYFY
jgi:hypothetical protein